MADTLPLPIQALIIVVFIATVVVFIWSGDCQEKHNKRTADTFEFKYKDKLLTTELKNVRMINGSNFVYVYEFFKVVNGKPYSVGFSEYDHTLE